MSKRSIPFIVGGVLVLGVCGVLAWEAFSPTGPAASSASASAAERNPSAAEIAALKPAANEAAPVTPDAEKLEREPQAPSNAPADEPKTSAPPAPARPPPVRQGFVGSQRASTLAAQRPPGQPGQQGLQAGATEQPPKSSSSKPGTITDFGGRRY